MNDVKTTTPQPATTDQGVVTESQRQRILAHLRANVSLTTLSARVELDCMPPGMKMHRIANYVLQKKYPVQLLLRQIEGVEK